MIKLLRIGPGESGLVIDPPQGFFTQCHNFFRLLKTGNIVSY